jgi:phenylalanine-4-hydroxylase
MSYKQTTYVAKPVDEHGIVSYTDDENAVWHELITRQHDVIQHRACQEYLDGLALLNFSYDKIPQCNDVSAILQETTGWALEPVPALISFDRFFYLLANRRFPAATFIRTKEELDYLKEPDIFHEIVGHCPLLTNPAYAEFTHTYGKLGLTATPEERVMLARLFWFTIEFGLIQTNQGLRAYGGGILSSINETVYCLESDAPQRLPFDALNALRTPYRIDTIQPIYFVLENFDQLYSLVNQDIMTLVHQAHKLGEHIPTHPC